MSRELERPMLANRARIAGHEKGSAQPADPSRRQLTRSRRTMSRSDNTPSAPKALIHSKRTTRYTPRRGSSESRGLSLASQLVELGMPVFTTPLSAAGDPKRLG